ncbi:endo-1,4-beta-xylanase [Arcicella aquatica]|uniref:endo-1,4-beta-xylanase n=1 Tax=Arcicella aquatica TaxID=217141 RepID=A0ABU5QGL9_9BACT|nr:endo-1,4-beta-xylanase [Arcicella aquatica]MEA5256200.1 endo-1,4-beta-xylanase [Arcicella aquatica]
MKINTTILLMKHFVVLTLITMTSYTAQAQLGRCKGKYFGNIIAGNVPGNYGTFWNQATCENASKWGSIEGTKGVYNWTGSDLAYNWAKNNGGLFKFHTLVWGAQTPGWVATASTATLTASVRDFINAAAAHYNPLGGLKMIDVLNEPVNTPMTANLRAALTAGYRAEAANAGDLNNQYGWAIWCFQLARKAFPNTTLLINEYNVEMNWNNCRAPYIAIVNAIKNAPNLTNGQKNLIDGVGLQSHGIENLTAANFKACIDEIWNNTGVPIHITEFDQPANPNETKQRDVFSRLIPVAWEHPRVAGITLWGYVQGTTWINGNGQSGAGGTDSGIIYGNGGDRPAMTWLKSYLAGRPTLSCCPAPAPFGGCAVSTNRSFVVRARGTAAGAQLRLTINNVAISTYNLTTSFANYTVSSTATGTVRLEVFNDVGTWDVEVDYLQVNGTTLQAENQPINTSLYSNGRCGGGGSSQMMNCNGYIEFASAGARIEAVSEVNSEISADDIQLNIFPNPVINGYTNVEFYNEKEQDININLYGSEGRVVKNLASQKYEVGTHTISVDCSQLTTAFYYLVLEKESGRVTKKIYIQR